jgi:hypothetical protein
MPISIAPLNGQSSSKKEHLMKSGIYSADFIIGSEVQSHRGSYAD